MRVGRCGPRGRAMSESATRPAKPRRPRGERAPTTPDPIEIAMEAEVHDTAADSPARTLLINQNRLVGWQIAGERAGLALKLLTASAGLGLAAVLAIMAWHTSRADGFLIKPFSVPPELVQRGVTGEAVANQLLDQLNDIGEIAR